MSLDNVDGYGSRRGIMYFCCWPCACDTKDLIKVDTKRVVLQDEERLYHFVVIGNPCVHQEKLNEMHDDPFGRGKYSLATSAPDLKCKDGMLEHAVLSDNGYVIVGLLHGAGAFQEADLVADDMSMSSMCQERASSGYASGMGTIFRLAAGINNMSSGQMTSEATSSSTSQPCSDPGANGHCCEGLLLEDGVAKIQQDIASNAIVLYGWAGCPCTTIARSRFQEKGVCFLENVWSERISSTMSYLNCKYGEEHHSFVWANGQFVGNGFAFDRDQMAEPSYAKLLSDSSALVGMCQTEGDRNLVDEKLQSCTQDGDGTTTGWTRSGSCIWDPSDAGYHQVCVTMSKTFLESSATYDANNLTSVVDVGGHWCICAWAWASAVSRDSKNMEGIKIDCHRTNARLRQVFQLHIIESRDLISPSGASYKAKAALEALDRRCPPIADAQTGRGDSTSSSTSYPPQASWAVRSIGLTRNELLVAITLVLWLAARTSI
jgi:hypothetical protein